MPLSTYDKIFETIKKIHMLGTVPDSHLLPFIPYFKELKLEANEILFNQGDEPEYVYILLSGELISFFVTPDGQFKSQGIIQAHDTVGELGALSGNLHSLSVKAGKDSEILALSANKFKQLCQENPTILIDVVKPIVIRSLDSIRIIQDGDTQKSPSRLPEVFIAPEYSHLMTLIRQVSLFRYVPDKRLIELLPILKQIYLHPGKILFRQGDPSDFIYLLIRGKLSAVLVTAANEYKMIGTIYPGETVGELGILSGFSRSLSVGALETSELIGIPTEVFSKLCHDHSSVLLYTVGPIINRSLQTLKLLRGEKRLTNIAIFPAHENKNFQIFRHKIQEVLAQYPLMKVINKDFEDPYDYLKLEKESEQQGIKYQVFFIHTNDQIKMQYLIERGSKFYFVADATNGKIDDLSKQIIHSISAHPHIKLNLVILHSNITSQPTNTKLWLNKYSFSLHHHVRLNQTTDYQRLCRFMSGTAIGVVFSGGGAKGAAHLGIIKAMLEKNIPIDAIGGTSIGALAAISFLLNPDLETAIQQFNWMIKKCMQATKWTNLVYPIVSMFSAHPLTDATKQFSHNVNIEDLWIPFFCVSSNLSEHCEVVHRMGPVWEALRSSASIPGIVPPVVINGHLHVDGGLLNNLPVDVMRNMLDGCKIIASQVSGGVRVDKVSYHFPSVLTLKQTILAKLRIGNYKHYKFPGFFDMFFSSLLLGSFHKERANSLAADLLIHPNLSKYRKISMLRAHPDQIIDIGYEEALHAIKAYFHNHKHEI